MVPCVEGADEAGNVEEAGVEPARFRTGKRLDVVDTGDIDDEEGEGDMDDEGLIGVTELAKGDPRKGDVLVVEGRDGVVGEVRVFEGGAFC